MKIIRIPGSHGDHVVRTDEKGLITCTCIAAQYGNECFAMRRIRVKEEMGYETGAVEESKLPDFQRLIEEQWAYIKARKLERGY